MSDRLNIISPLEKKNKLIRIIILVLIGIIILLGIVAILKFCVFK